MSEEDVAARERARIADALRRYFEDGPSTFRTLIDYLDIIDYKTAVDEGWLDFNNAFVRHEQLVAEGKRE